MADVFISYARIDSALASRLARILEARGFSVCIEPEVAVGSDYRDTIGRELNAARCVLALWSADGVQSRWVQREAAFGRDRRILVPVLLEEIEPPLGFRQVQAVDLSEWQEGAADPRIERLVGAVAALVQGLPESAASPAELRPPTGGSPAGWRPAPPRPAPAAPRPSAPVPSAPHHNPPPPADVAPPEAPATAGSPEPSENIAFTAYFPHAVARGVWTTLLAYVHLDSDGTAAAVEADSRQRLAAARDRTGKSKGRATRAIARGTTLTVCPLLPGFRVNPPAMDVDWLEDWHRCEFRVQPLAESSFTGVTVAGSVQFLVGPLLIGEVAIGAVLADEAPPATAEGPDPRRRGHAYQSVFVSYAHADKDIVQWVERAVQALGMEYLRDVLFLRSGERWNEQILKRIPEADLFQLFWSENAKASQYVREEWQSALRLQRPDFIRPCYWQEPMPPPPGELAQLHFHHLELPSRFGRLRAWLKAHL